MARKPFFSGNYGSALARVDTRPIVEAGRAQGQMFANMGQQIGGMIQQYGLNKEKRAELTGQIESAIKFNPEYLTRMTSTGDEMADKKAQNTIDKLAKGDLNMSQLKGLAGDLAMMEKVDLKAQREEDRKIARQQSLINQKLLKQEFDSKKKLKEVEETQKTQKDKAFTGLIARADEALDLIKSGDLQFDDLNVQTKRIVNDRELFVTRQVDPSDYVYSTDADAKAALDKLEVKKLEGDIKGREFELTEKTTEAAKMPEFTDKASALASVQDRDPGVSAKIVPFKGGFNVSMEFKAKDFPTSVQPLEGFDDVYSHGGYLYKGITDKNGKTTMTKIAAEQIGQRSDLLGKAIDRLDDKTLGNYRVAKRDGELNDDNDYEFTYRDPVTREEEEMTIPFNPILEDRLKYVDELTSKYQKTLDEEIDLDLTTR
jgi:hypothetical protein